MADDRTYKGVPVSELRIDSILWSEERSEHLRTRTARYPGRNELDLEPEWATEAGLDPHRIVSLTGGLSIEVVGWSPSAPRREGEAGGRLLKVWLIPDEQTEGGWLGASACPANEFARKKYEEMNDGTEDG